MSQMYEVPGERLTALRDAEHRYQNTLTWIRHVAGLHYLGGAFDPEHMRDLANMATAALQGKDFPDYAESMAKGREKAAEWAALFATMADDDEDLCPHIARTERPRFTR